jgi:hypothetical protein
VNTILEDILELNQSLGRIDLGHDTLVKNVFAVHGHQIANELIGGRHSFPSLLECVCARLSNLIQSISNEVNLILI